jgi:iron complex transport system substrate-binding protein
MMRAILGLVLLVASMPAYTGVERVVSVGGGLTEIVYALGAGDRLVAVDSTSTWPAAAAALPRVGYMRQLSAEGVLSMRPDVVLTVPDAGPPAALAQLRAAGVRVERLPADLSFEALRLRIRHAAGALGEEAAAARLDARLRAEWSDTQARVAAFRSAPRVLFVLAHGGSSSALVSGEGTAADAMIRLAGGRNAIAGFTGYKPLTAEAGASAAPEVLLLTAESAAALGGAEKLLQHPGLALTPAARSRRVVSLDALYLLGFGPRLPAAVRDLADRIHDAR